MTAFKGREDWTDAIYDEEDEDTARNRFLTFQVGKETYAIEIHHVMEIIGILNITEGGLHFYGAVLFGALAFFLYARRHKVDLLMVLDCAAPSLLIGQGIARFANWINQELYGPPQRYPGAFPSRQSTVSRPGTT